MKSLQLQLPLSDGRVMASDDSSGNSVHCSYIFSRNISRLTPYPIPVRLAEKGNFSSFPSLSNAFENLIEKNFPLIKCL